MWLPVAFGAGIGVYFALPFEPPLWAAPAAFAPAAAGAWFARRRLSLAFALWLAAAAAAGAGAAGLRTALAAAPILAWEHGPAELRGEVASVERRPAGYRVVVEVDGIDRLPAEEWPERVRLNMRTGAPPPPGRPIAVRAVLLPPPAPAAPGGFDFARALYFQRIGAVGYAVGPPRGGAEGAAAPRRLEALRLGIAERIEAAMTDGRDGDPEWRRRARIAAALLTGLRGGIDEAVLAWLRDSGLAHLLAISGLHLGLVAGLVFYSVRLGLALVEPLALRRPIKKWAAGAALAAAFGYLLLTGATIPTQRAFVMTGMVLAAVMLDREPLTMRPVAWAAFLVLAWRPESLVGASFQMSFAAVVALVAFYEAARERALRRADPDRRWPRPAVYLGGVVATTLVASLATAPFSAYHFHRVAAFGLAANLVAVPATAMWIMPCGLLALLLMPLGLEAPVLDAMGWGIAVVVAVAEWGAGLPWAAALVPAAPPSALACVALGGLWLAIRRGPRRLWGAAGIAAGLAATAAARGPDVLVNDEGTLFAVRTPPGGLALSSNRADRFAAQNWLRRAGEAEAAPWPPEGMACDSLGCLYAPGGGPRAALAFDARALAEDCAAAAVVVSAEPVRGDCAAPLVVDRFDLWRDGAHAVYFDGGGGARTVGARAARGDRPWAPPPRPRPRQ